MLKEETNISYQLQNIQNHFFFQVLEHVPLLLYVLAAKTLILCLAFAGVKMYQRKRLEAKQQKLEVEKKKQSEKKNN